MQPVKDIDDELKKDFFNCYKFENYASISDSTAFPRSIIGVLNYNADIEKFWNSYKTYIIDKYEEFQVIGFFELSAEIADWNDKQGLQEKFGVAFRLTNQSNSVQRFILSYYNARNINIEFYDDITKALMKEKWNVETYIELSRKYNTNDEDVDDPRLNIKQIINVADDFIKRFYHESTNNSRHYAQTFKTIYSTWKQESNNKLNLY